MQLTKNFHDYEFFCFHCGAAGIQIEFVTVLQRLRDAARRPIVVTSGWRCYQHPIEAQKYARYTDHRPGSHEQGLAADVYCPRMTLRRLHELALELPFVGVGIDDRRHFIHVDVKERGAHRITWHYHNGHPVYA